MDKVGALKDQYQNMLKELEEKGKLYKSLIDAYKFEMKQEFDWDKFLQNMAYKNRSLAEREYYHQKSLELREKGVEAKEQKQNAKKDADIGGYLKPNNEN
jgi:glycogen synthase